MRALVTLSCLTLCEPKDCSPSGSSVHGTLHSRILEWVAIPFSRRSSQPRDQTQVSCIAGRFFTIWATGRTTGFYGLVLLLLLLSHCSCVRLCVTLEMEAYQALLSLGFSRQEHWSRLLFPSPMHESEKWKWSRSVVSDSSRSHGLQPTRFLRPWDFPTKSTGVGCHCLLQVLLSVFKSWIQFLYEDNTKYFLIGSKLKWHELFAAQIAICSYCLES